MPPKQITSKVKGEVPVKRPFESEDEPLTSVTSATSVSSDDEDDNTPLSSAKPPAKPAPATVAARRPKSTATTKKQPTSTATRASTSDKIKPSIEAKPPASKRPRLPTVPKQRTQQLHAIGAQVFARPFTTSDRALKLTKVLATVDDYEWDELTRGWQCSVTFGGPPMPVGTTAWLPEKLLDGGHKVGELVSVKINGGWCDGEVTGRTVEGDDGWGYEVEVVGRVRASPKEIKAMTEVGKAKAEKFKGEIKEEL